MPEHFTIKQVRKYIKSSHKCPECGSDDLNARSVDIDEGGVYQEVTCVACSCHWWDVYKLVNIVKIGDGLASFIVQELYETYDSSLKPTAQLSEAIRGLNRAKRDIDTAINGLMELKK